jgi:hypothetical protein
MKSNRELRASSIRVTLAFYRLDAPDGRLRIVSKPTVGSAHGFEALNCQRLTVLTS